jgi:hypothetical protein
MPSGVVGGDTLLDDRLLDMFIRLRLTRLYGERWNRQR